MKAAVARHGTAIGAAIAALAVCAIIAFMLAVNLGSASGSPSDDPSSGATALSLSCDYDITGNVVSNVVCVIQLASPDQIVLENSTAQNMTGKLHGHKLTLSGDITSGTSVGKHLTVSGKLSGEQLLTVGNWSLK